MTDLLQAVGTIIITHSLWVPGATFSSEAGMASHFPKHPRITTYISAFGVVVYLLSYAVKDYLEN